MSDIPTSLLPVEVLDAATSLKQIWTSAVWDRHDNKCASCGGEDRLRLRMVVPLEAGGQYVASNGVILCRPCEIASDTNRVAADDPKRLINFWVHRDLHQALQDRAKDTNLKSMASLVRYLMTKYVEDPTRFDDLAQYQNDPDSDIKINLWVDKAMYATFKSQVNQASLSVTDAVKGLIKMYLSDDRKKE
jgi:hypothetical protein